MNKVIKGKFNVFKNLKIRKNFVVIFYITLFLVSLSSYSMNFEILNKSSIRKNTKHVKEKPEKNLLTSDYILVDRINISSPTDWGHYPFITGSGSDVDPYTIKNIEIQGNGVKTMEQYGHNYLNFSDNGIYIDAEGNFTIQNCRITSVSVGINIGSFASIGHIHNIENVEIDNCGTGIYSPAYWITLNISKCNISNCNWLNVMPNDMGALSSTYGGFGIFMRSKFDNVSVVEFCHIQNCSVGIWADWGVSIIGNHLIYCGFWFDFSGILLYPAIVNNTINGKPLGLFILKDNLTITGFEASQYGQLIFAGCDNLDLSNIHIIDSCSFGLTLHFCQHSNLENIICENQKVGFFFLHKRSLKTDNLLAKGCDVGFFLSSIFNSNMSRLFTLNNNIPFYISTIDYIANSTIEIEKETQLYLTNELGFERVYLNSSVSSFILSPQFIVPLDDEFFLIQINDTLAYRVVDSDFEHVNIDFIIKIYQESQPSIIPGFPIFWFYMAFLLGIIYLKTSFRRRKRIKS